MMKKIISMIILATFVSGQSFAKTDPRFLVGGVLLPEEDASAGPALKKSLEKAFAVNKAKVISAKDIAAWKNSLEKKNVPSEETPQGVIEARTFLAEGKTLFQKLQYEEALVRLLRSRRQFILALDKLRSNRDLIEAHLYLGMTYSMLGEKDKAAEEFKRVVYLDPKREIAAKEFPPSALHGFAKARQEVMATPESQVEVTSNPSQADIYLNGKLVGQTPLKLNLHMGEYFILIEKSADKRWFKTVPIQVERETVRAEMDEDKKIAGEDTLFRVRESADQQSDDLDALFEVANGVHADYVVLATVQKLNEYRLLGQLLDVKSGTFSKVVLNPMEQGLSGFDPAAVDVAHTLVEMVKTGTFQEPANLNLPPPKEGIAGELEQDESTPVIKPSKPWYKRWWIYPVVLGLGAAVYVGSTKVGSQSGSKVVFR